MLHKQTETKSFVHKANINQQKQKALFTKTTETNRLKSFVYKTNINKQKQTVWFTKIT